MQKKNMSGQLHKKKETYHYNESNYFKNVGI